MTTEFLVDTEWLNNHLNDSDIRIFDSTTLLKPDQQKGFVVESGRAAYDAGHIPGAGFLDLQKELSDQDSRLRFTLPSEAQFSDAVAAHGISNDSHVVLYSTTAPMWATRLWWMFRVFGHDKVSILDGGFAKWQKEGRPITTELPSYPRGTYVAHKDASRVVDKQAVTDAIGSDSCCILNALSRAQFSGEGQHYGRPGRIKSSQSLPWSELIDQETGCFHDKPTLQSCFDGTGALGANRVITYCGGGIAASVDLFALALLGMEDRVALYDNSLSEWAADENAPMEVG